MGFRNAAVFGGLDTYVARWALEARKASPDAEAARVLEEVRAMFADYGVLPEERRRERFGRAAALLEALASRGQRSDRRVGAPPPVAKPAPAPPPARLPALTDALQKEIDRLLGAAPPTRN